MSEFIISNEDSAFYKRPSITPEEAASGEYPCNIIDARKATFWMEINSDLESEDIDFVMLSDFPYPYSETLNEKSNPQHVVDWEIENSWGLEYLLGFDKYSKNFFDEINKFLQEENLTFNQPFCVEVDVYYYRCGEYKSEWDVEINCKVIDRKEVIMYKRCPWCESKNLKVFWKHISVRTGYGPEENELQYGQVCCQNCGVSGPLNHVEDGAWKEWNNFSKAYNSNGDK